MLSYKDSLEEITDFLYMRLNGLVPQIEIPAKAELIHEILQLKEQKNALILGHNYMEPALYHSVPDHTGDSLELARLGTETDKSTIVFCGVEFMAETAKILSPEKTVLLPAKKAGCSLASSITGEDVRALKKRFPGVPVVSYVNTYADVKAETDICCTSGNASLIINSLDSDQIIFLPDEYLAKNIAKETGKSIIFPSKISSDQANTPAEVIGWHGKCEVHDLFKVTDIEAVRKQHPDVVVLAHPECPPDVVAASDFSGSTSKIINYVKEQNASSYLLLTECSMGDNIAAENKDKNLLRLCSHRCPHMAQITLENTRDALLHNRYIIDVPTDIADRARSSLTRMLEYQP